MDLTIYGRAERQSDRRPELAGSADVSRGGSRSPAGGQLSSWQVEEAAELVKEWKDSIRNKKRARVTSALASMLPSFAKRGATAGASLKSLPAAT